MPARSSMDRDFTVIARRVVEQATEEQLNGAPLDTANECKNPHAVALGRMGGKKGGKARAAKLSPKKRKEIAVLAANARWHGK
jgi:hypothetical protein